MATTGRASRQEQEPASEEITEVAPGILRLQLPIHMPGLGHVNCYALSDEQGIALVDPGLPGPRSYRALKERLRVADLPLRRVNRVVVTHSHPDHFGGAPQLARDVGAEVVTHESFAVWWDPMDVDLDLDASINADGSRVDPERRTTPWGAEPPRPPKRARRMMRWGKLLRRPWFAAPRPSQRLADREAIRLAGRDWFAIHTPGHTPDHLCLIDPTEGVLLSGDHVLPTITPHIGGLAAGVDPLKRFFDSLDRVHQLDGIKTVLPAHGHPFDDVAARADAIRVHHLQRLQTLREAMDELGPATVVDLSHKLFSPRVWGPMAESETYAHLEHLRLAGAASRHEEGGILRYQLN